MSKTVVANTRAPSRRGLLRGAGMLSGGVALAAAGLMAGSSAAAPAKLSPKAAGYQDKPMGSAKCSICTYWQPPASCKLVQDPISPNGWCNLYSGKS